MLIAKCLNSSCIGTFKVNSIHSSTRLLPQSYDCKEHIVECVEMIVKFLMSIEYFNKNAKAGKCHFLKVFSSDLKTLSIRNKIKTISPLIVHGEDSTPVTFFEQAELAEFRGCRSAFVFV